MKQFKEIAVIGNAGLGTELAHKIAAIKGTNVLAVTKINSFLATPMRNLSEAEAMQTLLITIPVISKIFGAPNFDDPTTLQIAKSIFDNYKELSIGTTSIDNDGNVSVHNSELMDAFDLAANGKLGAKVAAYYGTHSAASWGQILAEYKIYRQKIAKEIRDTEREKANEINRQAKAKQKEKEAFAWFQKKMQSVDINQKNAWEQIPTTLYNYAEKSGLLDFGEGEQMQIFNEAKEFVNDADLEELESMSDNAKKLTGPAAIKAQKSIEKKKSAQDFTFIERAKEAARQITLFKKFALQ